MHFLGPNFLSFLPWDLSFLLSTLSFWPSGFLSGFDYVDNSNFVAHVGQNLILGTIMATQVLLFQKQVVLWIVFTKAKHGLIYQSCLLERAWSPEHSQVRPGCLSVLCIDYGSRTDASKLLDFDELDQQNSVPKLVWTGIDTDRHSGSTQLGMSVKDH